MVNDTARTASVDIEGVLSVTVDPDSLAAAREQIAEAASGGTETASGGTSRAGRGRTAKAATVDGGTAKIAVDQAKVAKDVQSAVGKDTYTISFDVGDLRGQIEELLSKPFTITVNAEMRGAIAQAELGTSHGEMVTHGAPSGRGPTPDEILALMTHTGKKGAKETYPFVGGIDAVYRNVNSLLEKAGKPPIGHQPTGPGHAVEQALELVDKFGSDVKKWIEFADGPIPRPTGGGTIPEYLKAQGAETKSDSLTSAIGAFGGDNKRVAGSFFVKLNEWMKQTPVQAQPAAAAAPMAQTHAQPAPAPVADTAAKQQSVALREQAERETKEVAAQQERSLRFVPIVGKDKEGKPLTAITTLANIPSGYAPPLGKGKRTGPEGPGVRGEGKLGPAVPEVVAMGSGDQPVSAEEAARRQLGPDRANVRRLRGHTPVQHVAGLPVILDNLERLAEMGRFQDVFEQFGGKKFNESEGFGQLVSEDVGGYDALSRLGKRGPGVKFGITGKEGKKFAALKPSEAFARTVLHATGAESDNASMEAVRAFLDEPEIADKIKKALSRGASPLQGTSGATKRGQGKPKIGSGPSDLGAQAKRLFEWIDKLDGQIADYSTELDRVNRQIEYLSGSGQKTNNLEDHARDLAKRIQVFRRDRNAAVAERDAAMASGVSPEVAAVRAAAVVRGRKVGGSKDVIEQQIGKDPAERAYNEDTGVFGNVETGKRLDAMVKAKELPSQRAITNAFVERYLQNQDRTDPATGASVTGYQTLKQVAFGPTGKPRKAKNDQDDTGLYGDLVRGIDPSLGPAAKREAQGYIADALKSVISDQGFKRALAEKDVARKETMARPALVGITGEGQYTGTPPGVLGALRSKIGIEEKLGPGHPASAHGKYADTHEELEDKVETPAGSVNPIVVPGLRTRLHELEQRNIRIKAAEDKRATARNKTLADPTSLSGDASRDIARDVGVFMEGEVRHAPFEKFNEQYDKPLGPGYERIEASLGAARESGASKTSFVGGGGGAGQNGDGGGFGEISGPIHVIIQGQPILVQWAGGGGGGGGGEAGGGGGGRRPPRGRVPADEQPEQPADETPKGKTPKSIRYNRYGVPTIDITRSRITTAASPINLTKPIGVTTTAAQRAAAAEAKLARQEAEAPFKGFSEAAKAEEQSRAAALRASITNRYGVRPIQMVGGPGLGMPIAQYRRQQANIARGLRAGNRPRDVRADIEQRYADRTASILSPTPPEVVESQIAAQQAQQKLQPRSLSTYLVSLAENSPLGNRREGLRKVAELRNAATRQNQLTNQQEAIQQDLTAAEAGRRGTAREILGARRAGTTVDPALIKEHRQYLDTVIGLRKASITTSKALNTVSGEITKLGGAVGKVDVARNLGAGFAGGVAGGLVAGGVSQVAGLVLKGVQETLGPLAERLSGFAGTTGRVQEGLATSLRANNDQLGPTLAQAGTEARLSDAQLAAVSGPLGARAKTVAGTQSLQKQFDLFNAAQGTGSQANQGFDRSLFRSTGGLFDLSTTGVGLGPIKDFSVGGQASTAETLASQVRNIKSIPEGFGAPAFPSGRGRTQTRDGKPLDLGPTRSTNAEADRVLAENNKQLGYLNENLKGSKYSLAQTKDETALAAQRNQFEAAGAGSLGQALADAKTLVSGINPNAQNPIAEVGGFLKTADEGPKLSAQQLLDINEPQRRAQVYREDRQTQFQIGMVNPQQTAMANLAQPTAPAAAGINLGGLSPAKQKELNASLAETDDKQRQINADTQVGVAAAKAFVSARLPQVGAAFAKSLDLVGQYGQDISKIQIGVQTEQANLAAKQYSVQLVQANRSLRDAKGLTGEITKQNGDNLGIIERQTFQLQRQSQSLSMDLSQKQINFQRAVASFQSPGMTSEQREANKQEAKLEADYAQKQLNIQKQLFGLSGSQFGIGAKRQVKDLNAQVDLLTRGRTLVLDTAVAEKRVAVLSKLQAKENKQVETYYAAAVQRTGDIMDLEAQLIAATQVDMASVGSIVLGAFAKTYQGMIDTINGLTPGDTQESASQSRNSARVSVTPGGGSAGHGGRNVTIQINNPTVRNDADINKIIAGVKLALQKEASLLLPKHP